MVTPSRRISRSALARVLITVALLVLAAPAAAQASGTITAAAGGVRSATDTDAAYAGALAGIGFEKAAWVGDPTTATWSSLCTTDATGACTSASVPNGRYLVRQAPAGAPAGWRTLTQLAWGGGSAGASPARSYAGDVTVTSGSNVTVRPSTDWSPTAPTTASGRFIAAKDNPALPSSCGLDVLLLLDRSGSITAQKDTYKAAAKQFVSTLTGTPTRLKIASFAADATADQASFLDLAGAGSAAAANAKIDSIYAATDGATNWDAGMKLAAGAGVDAVVFITDGNPTYRDAPTGTTSGSTVDLLDLTFGIASANKVKAAGATVLAVGAGTGVSAGNLAAVSGPTAGSDYVTSSVAGLDARLQQIANMLCGARIHVRELTDDPDAATPKADWSFAAGKPGGSPVTLAPATLTTSGAGGDDVISVDKIPATGASAITITQTPKPGYALTGSQCRTGGFADVSGGGTATATIATLGRNDDWYCTFRNAHSGRIVVRQQMLPAGDPATFGFTTSATGAPTFALGDDGNESRIVGAGTYSVTQIAQAGWALSGLSCDDGDSAGSTASGLATVHVAPGETVTCTFTNTKNGRVVVAQRTLPHGDPASFAFGGTASFSLGDGGRDAREVAPGTYTATQSAKSGWDLSGLSCDDADSATSTATATATFHVAPGETVTCTFTDTQRGTLVVEQQTTPAGDPKRFDFATDAGSAATFTLADDDRESRSVVPGDYSVTEAVAAGYRLTDVSCSDADSHRSAGTRTAAYAIAPGETVTCVFANTRVDARATVRKQGPQFAYHGDMLQFSFTVTNPGNGDLIDVAIADDRCAPVTPSAKHDAVGDEDATPAVLNPGDVWTFACAMTAPEHADGERNPVVNTVTVDAVDEFGRPVRADDTHSTRLLHPAVAIAKSGPAAAQAGDAVAYDLVVTNSGDVPFLAANVNVGDALCEAPPALVTTNDDATPGQLDPGDRWSFACTVRTLAGQTRVANVGTVKALDSFGGREVSDSDEADTVLTARPVSTPPPSDPGTPATPPDPGTPATPADPGTPQSPPATATPAAPIVAGPAATATPGKSGVLGDTAESGTARLIGPSACVRGPFKVSVRGLHIRQVAFTVDRAKRGTVRAASGRKLFSLRIDPRHQRFGVHRVSAAVRFTAASETSARTLRLVYQRCPRSAVKPQFAG